jgi:hypothetical protein
VQSKRRILLALVSKTASHTNALVATIETTEHVANVTAAVSPLINHRLDSSLITDPSTASQQRATKTTEASTNDVTASSTKSCTSTTANSASRITQAVANCTTDSTRQACVRQDAAVLATSGNHMLAGIDFWVRIQEGFLLSLI